MTARGFDFAMVLAAGRGKRMLPLTRVLPKPALPLAEGPVIASALHLASSAGVRRIVVNVHHLAERMAEAVAAVTLEGVEVAISPEQELMGSAGGLAVARDRGLLGDAGPVLVINGDGAFGLDLAGLTNRHATADDLVTLALQPHPDPARWSRVTLDGGGGVAAIRPSGRADSDEAPYHYPGVMAVGREALDMLSATPSEIPGALWQPVQASHRLGGAVVTGDWREVGDPGDYLEVMADRLAGRSVVDASARVGVDAELTASFVGRGAVIADGAVVESSIIAEGAVIEEGARVARSVLFGDVKVDAREVVAGLVLAEPTSS